MKSLYLIRHGEIKTSHPRRFTGQTDLPLTTEGEGQLAALGEHLLAENIEKIVTSPLKRSLRSSEILHSFWGVPVEVCDGLKEIDLGCWEGLTVAEVERKFPGEYEARGREMATYSPPGGESFCDLQERVAPAFWQIVEQVGRSTAVVAHAGVNRVLLSHLLGMPLEKIFNLGQGYGCYNRIILGKKGVQVDCINCMP